MHSGLMYIKLNTARARVYPAQYNPGSCVSGSIQRTPAERPQLESNISENAGNPANCIYTSPGCIEPDTQPDTQELGLY